MLQKNYAKLYISSTFFRHFLCNLLIKMVSHFFFYFQKKSKKILPQLIILLVSIYVLFFSYYFYFDGIYTLTVGHLKGPESFFLLAVIVGFLTYVFISTLSLHQKIKETNSRPECEVAFSNQQTICPPQQIINFPPPYQSHTNQVFLQNQIPQTGPQMMFHQQSPVTEQQPTFYPTYNQVAPCNFIPLTHSNLVDNNENRKF